MRRRAGDDAAERRADRRGARPARDETRRVHPPRHRARARLPARDERRDDRLLRAVAAAGRRPAAARRRSASPRTRPGARCSSTSRSASTAATSLSSTRIPPMRSSGSHAAGIRVGRVQLSSAIDVAVPARAKRRERSIERLRPFADSTYLHQVIERRDGATPHFPDLDDASLGTVQPATPAARVADPLPRAAVRAGLRRPRLDAGLRAARHRLAAARARSRRTSRSKPTRGTCCPGAEDRPARIDPPRVRVGAVHVSEPPSSSRSLTRAQDRRPLRRRAHAEAARRRQCRS